MKDEALQIVAEVSTDQGKLNHLREYLQNAILREMFELDWLSELVFHGGTALRMLHGLRRFSEDLDFHFREPVRDYSVESELKDLRRRLELNGYDIECSPLSGGAVCSSFVKFGGGLLYEAGISPHEDQKLRIKLEIDTNPPAGFGTDTSLLDQYFPIAVTHHDRETFVAGKCHAILQREWCKGRDLFDLLFYLTRWEGVEPNFGYLRNALEQTGYEGSAIDAGNWKDKIRTRVEELDWSSVQEDIRPFLLDPADMKAFRKEFLVSKLTE
ncbi:MAG: nucleotidyl transferase AbiEii/AbiGii toxin family protein [Candidatus Brocadiia bacterium]